jgi:hypothetical protein
MKNIFTILFTVLFGLSVFAAKKKETKSKPVDIKKITALMNDIRKINKDADEKRKKIYAEIKELKKQK